MGVQYLEHARDRYVELTIDGAVSKADIDRVMPRIRSFIDRHDRIAVLETVRRLGLVNLPAAMPYAAFGLASVPRIERVALVTGVQWLAAASRAAAFVSPVPLKVFGPDEEATARDWLTRRD